MTLWTWKSSEIYSVGWTADTLTSQTHEHGTAAALTPKFNLSGRRESSLSKDDDINKYNMYFLSIYFIFIAAVFLFCALEDHKHIFI